MSLSFNKVTAPAGKGKSVSQWQTDEVYVGYLTSTQTTNSRFGEMNIFTFADADSEGKPTGGTTTLIGSASLTTLLRTIKDKQIAQIKCLGKVGTSKAVRFEVSTAEQYL